jgi:hypothetical protein
MGPGRKAPALSLTLIHPTNLVVKFSELRHVGFLGSSLRIDGLRLVDLAEEDRHLAGGKPKDVLYQPLAFRCG